MRIPAAVRGGIRIHAAPCVPTHLLLMEESQGVLQQGKHETGYAYEREGLVGEGIRSGCGLTGVGHCLRSIGK